MEMVCAANVVSWDQGDEGGGTVGASGLHTSQSIGRDGRGRTIAIALCLNAGVDTSGVTPPHLDVSISDRLASRGVDDVDIQMSDSTLLSCQDILADELTSNP
jgi:hypothetical protein